LRLAPTPQESDGQHAERKGTACKDQRLSTGKAFDVGDELPRITLAQIPAEPFHVFRAAIRILSQRRLGIFLTEVLARLAKCLSDTQHRLDDVFLACIEPRCHLLGSLIHDWHRPFSVWIPRRIAGLFHADHASS